jgi:Ca2+/Na+ antiporter
VKLAEHIRSPVAPVPWFAVLGAPVAWGTQFAVGYWVSQADCSAAGAMWGISLDTWIVVLTAVALGTALGALASSIAILRATSDADKDDAPPEGRNHFLALVGVSVSPLFIALICITCLGVLELSCLQS